MSEKWWTKALSLIDGCTPVSESCEHCWLAGIEYRFDKIPGILQVDDGIRKPKFNGNIITREDRLDIPLKTHKPTVFAVWSDLFHEKVPDEFIYLAWLTMIKSPRHIFIVLTKRPERISRWFDLQNQKCDFPTLRNVWLGTTVENQEQADKRIPHLLKVPGKKFLSLEPLLGKIDLKMRRAEQLHQGNDFSVIVGAESGPRRRECKIEWVESIVEQCKAAGVPVFVKQLHINGKLVKDINLFPEHLRVRELPWRVKCNK